MPEYTKQEWVAEDLQPLPPLLSLISGSTEVFIEVHRYVVSCLPQDHAEYRFYTINVEYRAPGEWVVVYEGDCLGRDGLWQYEQQNSSRTDEWRAEHRFSLGDALVLATDWAPKLVSNNKDVAWVLAQS